MGENQTAGWRGITFRSGRKARERLNGNVIQNRFPHRSDIIAVLSIAVFVCFSWSIFGFFNKLSSFLLYLKPGEIAGVFAYMMAFALVESLVVTGILVVLGALLPASWLKEGFSYKGFVILAIATVDAILLQKSLDTYFPSIPTLALFSLVPIALTVVLIYNLPRMPKLQNMLVNIQDRFLILLFVYIPIGVISLLAVTFRNLL